jgi:ATP-dependent helicase/nuclease subunit A
VEREARLVAHRLRQLRDEQHPVWDNEKFRPAEWRDMVILMRSVEGRAERFAKEFNRAGVPLLASRAGFYSALEVMDLLNLLRLLDNPLQDLPLLAVLRSPLVGLTVAELAQVRLQSAAKPFWSALQQARRMAAHSAPTPLTPDAGDESVRARMPAADTLERIASFLKSFERWRAMVRQSALSHCLETILAETHYEALLLAGERGLVQAANVRRLLDLARQYDPYQRQGLFRFLRFIETQEEAELDQEPAAVPEENAVRLMTIHKSKGLEWPVVVVAGLGAPFNLKDLNEDVLLDEEHGLCPKVRMPDSDHFYPSLAHWIATGRTKRELLGEELRLFYVALTRARDTLVLVGTARRKADATPWTEPAPMTDRALATARCPLDWLRLWLAGTAGRAGGANEREGRNEFLHWKIYDALDPIFNACGHAPSGPIANEPERGPTAAELSALRTRLEWRYRHQAAAREPAKTSVTRLRRRLRDEADDEAGSLFTDSGLTPRLPSPKSAATARLTAAEIGTAHHTFLQMVSLERVGTVRELAEETERLRSEAVLSPEEIESLDLSAVAAFWQSTVGKQILSQRTCVHREIPFTARFTPEDLAQMDLKPDAADLTGEFLVVQGFVDLAVILPEEIWLLDFKTDAVSGPEWEVKRADYGRQLKLYGLALHRIYGRPVTPLWLHFLRLQKTVEVTAGFK